MYVFYRLREVDVNATDGIDNLGKGFKVNFGIMRDIDVGEFGNHFDHVRCTTQRIGSVYFLLTIGSHVNHGISGDGNESDLFILGVNSRQDNGVCAKV